MSLFDTQNVLKQKAFFLCEANRTCSFAFSFFFSSKCDKSIEVECTVPVFYRHFSNVKNCGFIAFIAPSYYYLIDWLGRARRRKHIASMINFHRWCLVSVLQKWLDLKMHFIFWLHSEEHEILSNTRFYFLLLILIGLNWSRMMTKTNRYSTSE